MIKRFTARQYLSLFSLVSITAAFTLVAGIAASESAPAAASEGGGPAASTAQTPVNPQDPTFINRWLKPGQYMKTSEIKPGMVGYGLTVFQGTKVERFNIKVIGVVKKVLSGRDAVLVRMSGPGIGQSNVIKGMSGSPVYIDGKLIGAISFGYDFSKEPIAGITPIVDMLDALAGGGQQKGPLARSVGGDSWIKDSLNRSSANSGSPRMVSLMSPVALVGFSKRAEEFLCERFGSLGMSVSSGAAGAMDPALATSQPGNIEPGSAVAVLLTTGDFYSVATGTATARFGNKVLAFGHPFLQAGAVDFPMATAYVHQILPSFFVSFKVASPIALAGSIVADRPWSVGLQVGRATKMIPAVLNVTDETRAVKRTFRCQVVDHPDLTPELLASTAISAIDATHQSSGPYVARVESRIEAEGIEPLVRVDRFSTNLSPSSLSDSVAKFRFVADPVGSYLLRTTSQITNNDFQKASIKSVKLDITLQDGHETATIEKVYVDRPFAAPGDTVKVSCILKPYDKEQDVENISLQIPRDVPDGNLLIAVCGGAELNSVKKRLGLVDPSAETLKQVTAKIAERPRGDALVMVAALPEQSLIVKGVKLVGPPAHWNRVFYSNRHTKGPSLVKGEVRVTKTTDWLIDGSHILTVEVRSPEKVLARKAPYMVSASGTDEGIVTTELARKAIEAFRKSQSSAQTSAGQDSGQAEGGGEKSATGTPLSAQTGKEYPHMRQALVWRQDTEEDFRAGKTEGATTDSWGRTTRGFQELAAKYVPQAMQIWSGVWSKGYFWFATSDQVWRWKGDDSPPEVVARLDAVAIPAMATDSKGTVYAASIPGGKIWAVNETDKPNLVYDVKEPIVTSLCFDAHDNLFIGVAGSGKVYKLSAAREGSLFFDSRQAHVLCLFYSRPEDKLYVGTGEKGSVYRLDAQGKAEALYQSTEHLVTGIARNAKADLYVSTAGQGQLVRVLPSGEGQLLAGSEAFYTLHYDPATDTIYSGDAEGDITQARLDPLSGQPYFVPICHTEQEAILALASDGQKHLFAGTSNLAMVRAFEMVPAREAVYSSVVRDAGRTAGWFHVRVYGAFNETNQVIPEQMKVETRTGETSQPDETWSTWQEAVHKDKAFAIASPAGRYLQYRLSWKTPGDPAASQTDPPVTVGRVDVTYLPGNSAPKFNSVSAKAGGLLSGRQTVSITGSDPDSDNLLLSVELSSDHAHSWKPLAADLRSTRPKAAAAKGADSDDEAAKGAQSETKKQKPREPAVKETDAFAEPPKSGVQQSEEKGDTAPADKSDKQPDSSGSKRLSTRGFPLSSIDDPDPVQIPPEGGKEGEKKDEKNDKGDDQKGDNKDKTAKEKESTEKVKDKAKPAAPPRGAPAKAAAEATSSETFSWPFDTKKYKDGNYLLKFSLDDRLSSPDDNLKSVALRAVVIDNSPPSIGGISSSRNSDGTLQFSVGVQDQHSPIANATYRIGEEEPFALATRSGAPDGLSAVFGVLKVKAGSGSQKVEIKVIDAAGNSATKTFTVK